MGGPTSGPERLYTPELADEICQALATGVKGLARLCDENPAWPGSTTIWRWLNQYPDFWDKYVLAKQFQSHVVLDGVLDLADKATDKDSAAGIRIRVDTRFRLAGQLHPKRYGNTTTLKGDKENPLIPETQAVSPLEAARAVLFMVEKAKREADSGSDPQE